MTLRNLVSCLAVAVLLQCTIILGPARAAPDIETYGKLPGIELVRLSPSGNRYAFIAVVDEQRRLVVAGVDGQLLFNSSVGDSKVRDLNWAGEDYVLLTLSATVDKRIDFGHRIEFYNAISVDLREKKAAVIFANTPSVANYVFGYYGSTSAPGKDFAYFGGISYAQNKTGYFLDHAYADLQRIDLSSGSTTVAARGTPKRDDWLLSPDGTVLVNSIYDEETGSWRLFRGDKRADLLTQRNAPIGDVGVIGFGRTHDTVLVLDNSGSIDLLEEVNVETGASEAVLTDVSVTEFLFDPLSRLLIGARIHEGTGAVFFDPRTQESWDSLPAAFPGVQVHLTSLSADFARIVIRTDGGRDAGTYWMVDTATGQSSPLGYEYSTLLPRDVARTQMVRYKASDGLEIEAVLTLPPQREASNLPLIVMPHGGPIGVRDDLGFDWWAQAYASAGYAILQPNYRGSSGYGRDFRQAGYGEWGKKMLTDISEGITAMAEQGYIDPTRTCIIGASYGGYAALAGVTLQQNTYRCAVSVAGVSDVYAFFGWQMDRFGFNGSTARFRREVTGAATEGDDIMREISPMTHAEKTNAPVLLIHGKDDTVVPFSQSEDMSRALQGAGKTVEFVRMDGEDHWLSREQTRIKMLKESLAFVKKHNPPD